MHAPRSSTSKPKDKKEKETKKETKEKKAAHGPPHVATPARLLLRVHSAKQLPHIAFSQGVYCKLYVGETAMINGSQKSLFSKMTGGHDSAEDHSAVTKDAKKDDATSSHRVFRTRTVPPPADAESVTVWDENFDLLVADASRNILSVRVKSKHRLYPGVLGVCAIPLKQLRIGHSVEKWVPLLKGTREVASLKLQIVLSPLLDPQKNAERAKDDVQADIKTALAANQSADDAIDRLLASATFKLSNRGGTAIPADTHDDEEEHESRRSESPRLDHARLSSKKTAAIGASTEHVPTAAAFSA